MGQEISQETGYGQQGRVEIAQNRRSPVLAAIAGFFVLTVIVVSFLPGSDKHILHTRGKYHSWGHLLAFAGVAFLAGRAFHSRRASTIVFFASLIVGFGIEWGEHVVFHGPIEWKDVLVDSLGVICGTLLAWASQTGKTSES